MFWYMAKTCKQYLYISLCIQFKELAKFGFGGIPWTDSSDFSILGLSNLLIYNQQILDYCWHTPSLKKQRSTSTEAKQCSPLGEGICKVYFSYNGKKRTLENLYDGHINSDYGRVAHTTQMKHISTIRLMCKADTNLCNKALNVFSV